MTLGDLQYESLNYFTILRRTNRKIYFLTIFIYILLVCSFFSINNYQNPNFANNTKTKYHLFQKEQPIKNTEKFVAKNFRDLVHNAKSIPMQLIFLEILKLMLLPLFIRRINDSSLHWTVSIPIVIFYVYSFIAIACNFQTHFEFQKHTNIIHYFIILILGMLPSSNKKEALYNDYSN